MAHAAMIPCGITETPDDTPGSGRSRNRNMSILTDHADRM
jgi:hypothetical protein